MQPALSPVVEGADELNVSSDSDEHEHAAAGEDDFDDLLHELDDIPTGRTP
eukprot:m.239093 g.239093  ORF g.239093 m.239093 type:complete len:51 (-) comp48763_c0_seq1:164-316(-)